MKKLNPTLIFTAAALWLLGFYSATAVASSVAMTVTLHKVSDNSLDSQINWSGITLPTGFVVANDYIQLDSTFSDATGGIQIYTDNTASDASPRYTGTISSTAPTPPGLVDVSSPSFGLPLLWRIITDIGTPPPANPNNHSDPYWYWWFYVEDKAQVANNQGAKQFANGDQNHYIVVENAQDPFSLPFPCPFYPPGTFSWCPGCSSVCINQGYDQTGQNEQWFLEFSPTYIYLEADFRAAVTPRTFKTSKLILEAFTP